MIGSLAERFWAKVDRRGPDECWPWLGSTSCTYGYGRIGAGGRKGRVLMAHRVSWQLANGPIPKGDGYHGTCVLHRCDNPACVNPAHLFLGTHKVNMHDAWEKGRWTLPSYARGERNRSSKLTEAAVAQIRAARAAGKTLAAIASRFGVSFGHVGKIVSGKAWVSR